MIPDKPLLNNESNLDSKHEYKQNNLNPATDVTWKKYSWRKFKFKYKVYQLKLKFLFDPQNECKINEVWAKLINLEWIGS